MQACEIMTRNPEVLRPSDSIERAALLMREIDVGIIPVVEEDGRRRLRGVITDRDIVVRHVAEGHGPGHRVEEAMSSDGLVTAGPDEDASSVMRKMREAQVRRIPVLEDGELVGIVAQADLAVEVADEERIGETVEAISEPAKPAR